MTNKYLEKIAKKWQHGDASVDLGIDGAGVGAKAGVVVGAIGHAGKGHHWKTYAKKVGKAGLIGGGVGLVGGALLGKAVDNQLKHMNYKGEWKSHLDD